MPSSSSVMIPMADKKRDDRTVKLEARLARKAAIVAESKGVTLAEYLSDVVRGPVERDYPSALKKLGMDPNA